MQTFDTNGKSKRLFCPKTLYGLSDLDDSWQRNAARGHTTFVTLRAVSFLSSLIWTWRQHESCVSFCLLFASRYVMFLLRRIINTPTNFVWNCFYVKCGKHGDGAKHQDCIWRFNGVWLYTAFNLYCAHKWIAFRTFSLCISCYPHRWSIRSEAGIISFSFPRTCCNVRKSSNTIKRLSWRPRKTSRTVMKERAPTSKWVTDEQFQVTPTVSKTYWPHVQSPHSCVGDPYCVLIKYQSTQV